MYVAIIAVIAAVVLFYFSFKPSQVPQPELVEDALEDIAVTATVKYKTVESNPAIRQSHLKYFAVFALDTGEDIEFSIGREIYGALNEGDRDTLVYHGEVFVGFGDIGASADSAETDGSGGEETASPNDSFTLDDYDESIDVEIAIDTEASGGGVVSGEDREDYDIFINREKLPVKTETITGETESYAEYPAGSLLDKVTIYPFLKREIEVREMFLKTYSEAVNDLLGYSGGSRTGRAADSIFLKKNEIRVVITIEEKPLPLLSRIEAEFGVNE